MNSQTPKMRLIAMFYLLVFASALLASGALRNQRSGTSEFMGSKTRTLVSAASTDSLPSAPDALEPGENSPEISKQADRPDSGPLFFSFNFTSVLQWLLGLSTKTLSVNAKPVQPVQPAIWLSVHNLRI